MEWKAFLWALLGAIAAGAILAYWVARRIPPAASPEALLGEPLRNLQREFGGLLENVRKLPSADLVEALKERVAALENRVAGDLATSVQRLHEAFTKVEAEFQARKTLEERSQEAIQRIEAVVAGAQSRGAAGEGVLAEAFAQFPAEMGDTQFKVNGKPVEFALVLPNQKRLPIDSKWPAVKELEQYSTVADPAAREELLGRIEKAVLKKVEEVTKYIDPASTAGIAVAAVPDAAYFACRTAHIEAYRQRVLLMPYSLTIPFLLALYNLHLQFARSVDMENLDACLSQVETYLGQFEEKLDNSVERGATMVLNAYQELRQRIGQMRGVVASLRRSPVESLTEREERLPDR